MIRTNGFDRAGQRYVSSFTEIPVPPKVLSKVSKEFSPITISHNISFIDAHVSFYIRFIFFKLLMII